MKVEYMKSGACKLVDPENEALIEALVSNGWDVEAAPSERDVLKAKAKEMGLEFPSNIKTDKLKKMIEGE